MRQAYEKNSGDWEDESICRWDFRVPMASWILAEKIVGKARAAAIMTRFTSVFGLQGNALRGIIVTIRTAA